MEALQMAQVLADLSTLKNTEASAASALVNANKNLSEQTLNRKSKASIIPDPPQFDKLGRRRCSTKTPMKNTTESTNPFTLTRMESDLSSKSGRSSGAATPATTEPQDADMSRAKKLLELYQMRDKFKEMGDTGLARAKERVEKVFDSYSKKEFEESAKPHPFY
ncbi:hypothetical protein BJ875DRAFT_489461 [Amylocarpus encephaloides]|uniref:Uncharacterized protein n=1 Tax=Amylocarpus encephaloides TaxID=45428 RepID=A0A9P7Y7M4_9HELO|nr:hypothetical protein BJ875DRAFT_489461 [Amylocarpus encephaloides]